MHAWLALLCLCMPQEALLRYHEARATAVLTVLLADPQVAPTPPKPTPPDPSKTCTCNGTKKSGDGIGPCPCAANGTCPCGRKSGPSPRPREPAEPKPAVNEVTKQVLIFVMPGCPSCLETEQVFPSLRKVNWKVGPEETAHFRVVDLADDQPEWITDIGRLKPADDTIWVVQAVFIENRQPLRRTTPGQALTARNLTDLYYGTTTVIPPRPVQQPTRQPVPKPAQRPMITQSTIKETKQHLIEDHGHEIPRGIDLDTLSNEELEQLHTALHNVQLVPVTRPVIRRGKIIRMEVIQQQSRPNIPAEWFNRKKPRDKAVGAIREHEVYGVQEYVTSALDNLWTILADGGQLSLDLSKTAVERYVTIPIMKRAGLELPNNVKMVWSRTGETLRVAFTGDKPKVYFKLLWKSSIECPEITITKEKAVLALNSIIIPDQTIIFKTGTQ